MCAGLLEGLQVFSGLEPDGATGSDVDLFAGAWVAADSGLAGSHGEDAEAAQLDTVACGKSVLHATEDGVHGCFGLVARQTCAFDDSLDEVLLYQAHTPLVRVEE